MSNNEFSEMAKRLRACCIDYDGSEEADGAPPVIVPSCAELRQAAALLAKLGQGWIPVNKEMVDRFLAWPLPDSVCSDECVTKRDWGKEQGWPKRVGTNLLTADEARQMLEYVLKGEAK